MCAALYFYTGHWRQRKQQNFLSRLESLGYVAEGGRK